MTADAQSAREDLAFLKTLVDGNESAGMKALGESYLAGGLIYGGQVLLPVAQGLGWLPQNGLASSLIGIGPTALFIPVLIWIIRRNQTDLPKGVVGRAVAAVFAAIGLSNLFLIVVVGAVAWREGSQTTWLIYPCTVFVLQGTAWLFAFMMRRRNWLLLVAIGWFVCAVGMALSVVATGYYTLFAGLGLMFCMALPGWVIIHRDPQTV
jgi:hypothetical protein